MVLQELVQPKALFFIGVYFGTGLAVAYLVVMAVASILSSIFSPKNTSVEEILAQMEKEQKEKEDKE